MLSRVGQNVLLGIAAVRILFNKFVVQRIFKKPPPIDWLDCKALCLGLDGAGKTSLVRHQCEVATTAAAVPTRAPVQPTSGFDVRTVVVPPDVKLEVWEVGGSKALRPFWNRYVDTSINALVWVVDAADASRLGESATELANVLKAAPRLRRLPLLVLLNKADLPGGQSSDALQSALGLASLQRNGPLRVACTSSTDGRELEAALRWLADCILGRGGTEQAPAPVSDVKVERA